MKSKKRNQSKLMALIGMQWDPKNVYIKQNDFISQQQMSYKVFGG